MADDSAVEVICPEVDLLTKVETNLICPLDGCTKLLPNTSSLRMHLVKTHNVVSNAKENEMFDRSSCHNKTSVVKKKTLYCCPVDCCVRGRNGGRPFSRLAHVKQHYMTVHGEKKFSCKICSKKFGRSDACLRHEKACGKVFPCSCGCPFNSRTSMLTHAKRNGHTVPDAGTTTGVPSNTTHTSDKTLSSPVNSQPLCISVLSIVSTNAAKGLRPLKPKKLLANAETQTDQPCFCTTDRISSVQTDKSVTVDVPMQRSELNACCGYTQTMDEAYTQTSFITDEQHFDMDFAIDNEELKELTHSQTQTNWGLAFDSFPLSEDNETQTLESYLGFDPSNITTDCATQTKKILDDIFSVDTETQTLFPAINFVEEQFDSIRCNNGMDSQTQTLHSIYLDNETLASAPRTAFNILPSSSSISNVETQTP